MIRISTAWALHENTGENFVTSYKHSVKKQVHHTHTHKVNFLTGRNWTEHRSYIMLENDSHGQCMGLGTGPGLWMAVESPWLNHGVV